MALEIRNTKLHETLERGLRNSVKSGSLSCVPGFLAEDKFFNVLKSSGVPYIRAPEAGAVDGVFVIAPDDVDIPCSETFPTEAWHWVESASKVALKIPLASPIRFIPFDIKYLSLMPAGLKAQDYAYISPAWNRRTKDAVVYILLFESISDYAAIVPKQVFDASTDTAYGVQPLISGIPTWCAPFMLLFAQIRVAVARLLQASNATWYRNPTTGVLWQNFTPKKHVSAPIWPRGNPSMTNSLREMRKLFTRCRKAGHGILMNPIQPLWCDFLLDLPLSNEALRVEFKLMGQTTGAFERGRRSPFAAGRQWHILICKISAGGYLCFPRHQVLDAWSEELPTKAQRSKHFYEDSNAGFQLMLRDIARWRQDSLHEVECRKRNPPSEGYDIRDLLSSSCEREVDLDTVDLESVWSEVERVHHAKGLPWLCGAFNKRFCKMGKMICLPLDIGHRIANHIVVPHVWTEQDQYAFRENGKLPHYIFEEVLQRTGCVALRFIDLSTSKKGSHTFPIYMRQAYWTWPVSDRRFIIIGSTMKASLVAECPLASSYLFMPSEFTSMHSEGPRPPMSSQTEDPCGYYFRKNVKQRNDALPKPKFTSRATEVKPIRQGGPFMSDPQVNPLRYIFDEAALCGMLDELTSGNGNERMRISNPQSRRHGVEIIKQTYRATVMEINQACWDFGLTRKLADESVASDSE